MIEKNSCLPLPRTIENLKTCHICNKAFDKQSGCNNHLRSHGITIVEYYNQYYIGEQDKKCLNCGMETKFNFANLYYYKYCSRKCSSVHHKVRIPCSEERKNKIRLAHLGRKRTRESIIKQMKSRQGYRHSEKTKEKIGLSNKGKHSNMEVILRSAKTRRERNRPYKPKSDRFRLRMRQIMIERIKRNGGCVPSYNDKACEYFKEFDKMTGGNGKYAVYGGGEYHVKELGYFLDYIDFNKKIIIEWDEKYHFRPENIKKHERRDREIKLFFNNYLIIRILDANPISMEEIIKLVS